MLLQNASTRLCVPQLGKEGTLLLNQAKEASVTEEGEPIEKGWGGAEQLYHVDSLSKTRPLKAWPWI